MKLRQYFVKLKISKSFNTGKWERCIEYFARLFVLASVIVLAMWTIFTSPLGITWFAKAFLIIFISAAAIVFYFEARHLFRKQPSNQQESTQIPTLEEQPSRNRWALLGMIALAAIILIPVLAKQRLPDPQEYQSFLTAFAGVGAWVIGIALVVFTYQQYKLRQTEHNLLFNPQLILTSGDISFTGSLLLWQMREPYTIKWTVYLQNTSQIPILIQDMNVYVRLVGEESSEQSRLASRLTPRYCHIVEPENLMLPFEVTLTKPYHIMWLVDGSAGDVFDYVSRGSGNRDFVLIFEVAAKRPQDPKESIFFKETTSWGIHVPKDANWVSKTPFLDKLQQE